MQFSKIIKKTAAQPRTVTYSSLYKIGRPVGLEVKVSEEMKPGKVECIGMWFCDVGVLDLDCPRRRTLFNMTLYSVRIFVCVFFKILSIIRLLPFFFISFFFTCLTVTVPSKHAGSDPETFWLRPVMAITASVQPESGRIVYAGPDFPHPFQLRFSKEGMDHIAQNRSESDLDGLVRVWPNKPGLEASRCVGIICHGFWQDATGPLPVSHFQTRFRSSTDVPDNITENQPGSDLVLARLCQVLAKRIPTNSRLYKGIGLYSLTWS